MLSQSLISILSSVNSISGVLGQAGNASKMNSQLQALERLVEQTSSLNSPVATQASSAPALTQANSSQLSQVTVNSSGTNQGLSLQGSVLQAAKSASLTVVGGTGGVVTSWGQYALTGSVGSATLNVSAGESLATLASQVNSVSKTTGVQGAVVGNNLVLTGTTVGSNSTISFLPVNVPANSISGLNSNQVAGLQVQSEAPGTSDVLSGSVISSASQGQVVYQGTSSGTIAGTATFQLTGSLGSTNISITEGQSLTSAASNINQQTSSTGVVASVKGDQLFLTSNTTGANAFVQINAVDPVQQITTSGINQSQVSDVNVESVAPDSNQVITGQVLQSATQASVTLAGSSTGTVIDSATFQLTGALGSTDISIQQGQSLTSVAENINAESASTGVVASVESNNLVFQSTGVGSAANVGVQLTDITHTTEVSGANSQQFSTFQVNSIATGASDTLTGQVVQSATQAALTLQGSSSGTVVDSATFQLTGALGTTNVAIQQGQSLASVAAAVNSQTSSTGVVASVVSNNLVFASTGVGSSANVGVQLTNISYTTNVTGVNSQQLSGFQTNSFTNGASDSLSGQVLQTATQASETLQGSSTGTVVSSATFQLTGSDGTANISIVQGQSLTSVASAVNALTASTGVVASVVSNNLVFKSTGVGSAANVGVSLTNIAYTNSVSGVNSNQLSSFQINSLNQGASETLSGAVTQTAGAAQLTYTGTLGLVTKKATFTLQGSLGSVQISATKTESLSTLVSQINAATSTTGVAAVLSGNTVKLQSVGVGSNATVAVKVTSGTFSVTGGNGNGTANGTNALATINGKAITGNGDTFQYTDALGSYSFTTAMGYTGTISSINVSSQAGQFNLTGGNANGVAKGSDAVARINGQTLTGTGDTFQYSDAVGSYTLNTAPGFTGNLNTININSQAGQFNLTGGNGNGTANGTNAVADVNGQTITGNGNAFQYSDGTGSYSFTTASGFTGSFNPINVESQPGQFSLTGGNGDGTAHGSDAVAIINGQTVTGTGDSFQVSNSGGSYQIQFAQGFQGSFNPITVQSQASAFNLQGADANGASYGTDLVSIIEGVEKTSTTNQTTVQTENGTYNIAFANGFVGQISPITISSNTAIQTTGGEQSGVSYGSDVVAEINGQVVQGHGSQITYAGNGVNISLDFNPGFQGTFSPISINQGAAMTQGSASPASTTNGSAAAQQTNSGTSNSELIQAALKIFQNESQEGLVLNQINQARDFLNELSAQSAVNPEPARTGAVESSSNSSPSTDTTETSTLLTDLTRSSTSSEQPSSKSHAVSILA